MTECDVVCDLDEESGANVRMRLAAISKNSITFDTGSSVDDDIALSLSPSSQLNERLGSRFSISLSSPISPLQKRKDDR